MPRVTQKGQVTIPRDIRRLLDVKPGDDVLFEVREEKVVLKKSAVSHRNFARYTGYLSHLKGKSPDDIVETLRGGVE